MPQIANLFESDRGPIPNMAEDYVFTAPQSLTDRTVERCDLTGPAEWREVMAALREMQLAGEVMPLIPRDKTPPERDPFWWWQP